MRAPSRACGSRNWRVVGEGVAGLLAVAGSLPSMPVTAPSRTAASVTLRAIGPAVSWSAEIGTTPARLQRPRVGLIPTIRWRPRADDRAVGLRPDADGREVRGDAHARPGARAARVAVQDIGHVGLAADAAPAARRRHRAEVRPLRQVRLRDDDRAGGAQPLDDERVAGLLPASAHEPAVVGMSVVSTLSFTSTGMPRSGPVVAARRALSAARACASAVGRR